MDMCLKTTVPLVTSVSDTTDSSTSSCPPSATSEDSVPEGYLIITFDKKKKAILKTAVFADVSDPRFTNDFDDDNCGDEECNDDWCSRKTALENSNSDTEDSVTALAQTTKLNKANTTDSTYASCYGEALWVGEGEVSDRDVLLTTKNNSAQNVKNTWISERHVQSNSLIETKSLLCHHSSTSETQTSTTVTSGDRWPVKAQHRLNKYVGNYTYRRSSFPLRLAKKYNQNVHFMRPNWSRSYSAYPTQCLNEVNSNFGDHSRKMLRCDECGKYYRNEYSLHHHICLKRKDVWKKGDVPSEVVNGQIIYFCPTCHKPFKWLGNLTRHFYVHTGQRFFRCDICSKEFFSAYQVKRHMNSHTGMRFKCEVCDKPFTCKYACIWHTRQHYAYSE